MTPDEQKFWCVLCRDFRTEIHFRGFGGHKTGEPGEPLGANPVEDALRAIAGDVDSCGHSHGSTLHDIGRVAEFASRVLRGEDPHDVLEDL